MTNIDRINYSELCFDKNPALWRVFCIATKRDPDAPNYLWEESDVIEFMELKLKEMMRNERK